MLRIIVIFGLTYEYRFPFSITWINDKNAVIDGFGHFRALGMQH